LYSALRAKLRQRPNEDGWKMITGVAKSIACELIWRSRGRRGSLAATLGTDGLAVRNNDLNPGACATIRQKMDELIEAKVDDLWVDPEGADHRIWHFERYYPDVKKLIDFDGTVGEVAKYVGRRVIAAYLMANKINAVPNNLGSGGGLHRDSAYTHQVKVIWYLNDVTMDNGPFAYARQSASLRSVLFDAKPIGATRLDYVADRFLPNMVTVIGNAGTRLSADTMGVHQGLPIRLGSRYAMTLYTEH
jgi:hypothetical protein